MRNKLIKMSSLGIGVVLEVNEVLQEEAFSPLSLQK